MLETPATPPVTPPAQFTEAGTPAPPIATTPATSAVSPVTPPPSDTVPLSTAPSSSPPPTQGFPHFGIVLSLFIGVVALLIAAVAYFMGFVDGRVLFPQATPSPSPEVEMLVPASPSPEMTVCTMDAMMCPDGSYVGRTGPNCEFVCPGGTGEATDSATLPQVQPPASMLPTASPSVGITY